jgi:pyroglutamyl-peptidase
MPLTVLITGFGPFPGAPFNPTEALVKRLAVRRRAVLADLNRIAHVFRVSYATVDAELPGLLKRHKPDVLLMFGLAAGRGQVCIETRARNAVSQLSPDVGGRRLRTRGIRPGAAPMKGRAPFRRLLHAAQTTRVPVRLSRNAGTYLCNYLYWRSLEGTAPLAVFVHVPLVARPGHKRRRLTLDDLARAGEAVLMTLVSAARTQAQPNARHPLPGRRGYGDRAPSLATVIPRREEGFAP